MHYLSSSDYRPFRLLLFALMVVSLLALACDKGSSRTKSTATLEGLQSPWVQERIAALETLYDFTLQGRLFLEALDLRQMRGQPGWFGSFGFDGWTGVGEAKPESIVHEVGHAYWGAFAVIGRPDLSWDTSRSGDLSSAMSQYHQDLITFMAQPPDPFEPLRQRLRNLPQVLLGASLPLFHFGEADLVHTVGGNVQLLPPILRKYYDQYLPRGSFGSWYAALEWYQGLSPEDARMTGAYFGLTHFPLSQYRDLRPSEATALPREIAEAAAQEEQQRLVDFARQFNIVTGVEEVDGESFDSDLFFFRGYLRDKLALYGRHPQVLSDLEQEPPMAADLDRVFGVFASLRGAPLNEQADILGQHIGDPFFSNFWPLVDSALLMELYRQGVTPADTEPLERATDDGIEQLSRVAGRASRILERAREDLSSGARALEEALTEALKEDRAEVSLLVEMLSAADREIAQAMGRELDEDLVRTLLEEASGALRRLLAPQELLPVLGITPQASADELVRGIRELLQGTSGNFRIDQPYFSQVYALVALRGESRPREALDIVTRSGLLLEDLLREYPQQALAILASDMDQVADHIAGTEGHGRTPQRLVHAIIGQDPLLAARLVTRLESRSPSAVREALIYFAYDSYRKARLPSLEVSPEKDGLFLLALAELRGEQWVIRTMGEAIATYDESAREGTVPPDFLQAHRATLTAAAEQLDDPDAQARLRSIARAAFSLAGVVY
jgi:hypothetical protein